MKGVVIGCLVARPHAPAEAPDRALGCSDDEVLCPDCQLIAAWIDYPGGLSMFVRTALGSHLERCAQCRLLIARVRDTLSRLSS